MDGSGIPARWRNPAASSTSGAMFRSKSSASRVGDEHPPRPRDLEAEWADEKPQGGHHPRPDRKDDPGDPKLAGDRERVHRAGAPERDHGRVAIVEPSLRGVDPERSGDVLVRDLVHPPRGPDRIEPRRRRHVLLDRDPRRARIQAHLAAEEEVGIEVAEDHVRVGQGGAGAALAVAGRTPGPRPRSAARPG